ncbi:hypothetical protein [Pseudarthrobacter chlorophenolicus]|uniref:hypothetical protein n=1 Tax=Pseudarthrobacter chlorophenolicus TaxID=85085 RepID=UPI0006990230|nr:hypothetical protein [Pseudarthrobacter chlorophenolicus]
MANDSGSATAEQKSSALAYAGRSRIGGLALLDEPGGVCELRVESWLPQPAGVVIDFCLQRQNFVAIMPDRMQVLWSSTEKGQLGGTYHFRWWLKNLFPIQWVAFIDSYTPGRGFSDQQVRGFFRYFHHTHTAVDEGNGCRYTDTVRFAGPFGPWVDRRILLGQMQHDIPRAAPADGPHAVGSYLRTTLQGLVAPGRCF